MPFVFVRVCPTTFSPVEYNPTLVILVTLQVYIVLAEHKGPFCTFSTSPL